MAEVVEDPDITEQAGDEEAALEEVIVTGSRIPRSGYQFLQPTAVLDKEVLDLRANLNIVDSLRELPTVALGSTPIGPQGRAIGRNTVSFFGLGTQRTLSLVNGQRFPASGLNGQAVDFNAIPSAIVERVETVAIGGAPIYGADAIAGTINVILRDDFEGFEALASFGGSTEYGDNESWQVGLTWGSNFADNRGNVALTAQHDDTNGLLFTDRPLTSTVWGFEVPGDPDSPYDLELFDNLIVATDSQDPMPQFFGFFRCLNIFCGEGFRNGIPFDISDPDSPLTAFDADGNLIPFSPGGGTGNLIFQNGGDGLNLSERNSLFADIERSNVNLFANFDLTDVTRLHGELWLGNTRATELATQGGYNSNAFGGLPGDSYQSVGGGPIGVLIDSPYLPEASRETILEALNLVHDFNGDGQADPTIDTDGDGVPDAVGFWITGNLDRILGQATRSSDTDFLRGVVGLDGSVEWADREFQWDTYLTWGRYDSKDSQTSILQRNFERAVQVVVDENGNPACADPSGGCVPLNVIGTPTPEAIDYVSTRATDRTTVEQTVFTANITGEAFALPAGPVSMAIGFSWRDESASYVPDPIYTNGQARFERTPIDGGFDSTEAYLEALVPLLGGELDTPGVH
ncbi:MAG: TonB-dependent receptor plug domain-containing protein, partial [Desulfobacterales bacterium]